MQILVYQTLCIKVVGCAYMLGSDNQPENMPHSSARKPLNTRKLNYNI